MSNWVIDRIAALDMRYPLPPGAGSDAVHTSPEYCLAVTYLGTTGTGFGTGITLTLGEGNRLVCDAIELLASPLGGREIEEVMAEFGMVSKQIADNPAMRWLGPHKGVVHLALASITNACFDLWAKSRGVPLWKLLLDLDAKKVIDLLDLSYLEEVLPREEAERILRDNASSRGERAGILRSGYPGYDTSVGCFQYDDVQVKKLTQQAIERGFHAFK